MSYETHYKKLIRYARKLGIRVDNNRRLSKIGASYYYYIKTLDINLNYQDSKACYILAHEIGHAIDQMKGHYLGKAKTWKQTQLREIRCWEHAEKLLKRLNIPLGRFYKKVKDYGLNSYGVN